MVGINLQLTRTLTLAVVSATVSFGYYVGMPLVEYQKACAALHSQHDMQVRAFGMAFVDGEARRSQEQAALNAKHGKGIANSLHVVGLARDKFLVINGRVTFNAKDYQKSGELWEHLGVEANIPTAWGGRFKSVDAVHFSCAWKGVK